MTFVWPPFSTCKVRQCLSTVHGCIILRPSRVLAMLRIVYLANGHSRPAWTARKRTSKNTHASLFTAGSGMRYAHSSPRKLEQHASASKRFDRRGSDRWVPQMGWHLEGLTSFGRGTRAGIVQGLRSPASSCWINQRDEHNPLTCNVQPTCNQKAGGDDRCSQCGVPRAVSAGLDAMRACSGSTAMANRALRGIPAHARRFHATQEPQTLQPCRLPGGQASFAETEAGSAQHS